MNEFLLTSLENINTAASWAIENFNSKKIVLVDGEMGAGKTTLIKAIGKL